MDAVDKALQNSKDMKDKIEESRRSTAESRQKMADVLGSLAKTRETCENALGKSGDAGSMHADIESQWKAFQAKFDQLNKNLIGSIAQGLGRPNPNGDDDEEEEGPSQEQKDVSFLSWTRGIVSKKILKKGLTNQRAILTFISPSLANMKQRFSVTFRSVIINGLCFSVSAVE